MTPATARTETATAPVQRSEGVLGGKAVIAGTRIPVFMVDDLYRKTGELAQIREAWPHLEDSQVLGTLFYASANPDAIQEDRKRYWASIPKHMRP